MADTLDFRIRMARGAAFRLDVAESIPLGGITAITGPSGSGKTTLLRSLAGLERRADARVRMRGQVWEDGRERLAVEDRRIGFVFQEPMLFPHLSVEGNLAYGARRRSVRSFDAIIEALNLGPLLDRRMWGLSGGEQRRVALGRALASGPTILFLDEPLVGLDGDSKAELLPYIARAVNEAQVPAIYVSHAVDEVATLADRVLTLAAGRLSGWQTPPLRLFARVVDETPDGRRLRLVGAGEGEDADLVLPLRVRRGEVVGLGLPQDSVLISTIHPGRHAALAVFPGLVESAGNRTRISVFGQSLIVGERADLSTGTKVWVSILRVLPRPERPDSHQSAEIR